MVTRARRPLLSRFAGDVSGRGDGERAGPLPPPTAPLDATIGPRSSEQSVLSPFPEQAVVPTAPGQEVAAAAAIQSVVAATPAYAVVPPPGADQTITPSFSQDGGRFSEAFGGAKSGSRRFARRRQHQGHGQGDQQ